MVAKTRQSDKVRGRACELYLLQDQDDKSPGEICVAKGIGNALHYGFLAGNIPGQKGYPAWLPLFARSIDTWRGTRVGSEATNTKPNDSTTACS